MKPNLVKRNIIIEILKKNNVLLQEHVSIKNTYFFNFILFSIILFGLLLGYAICFTQIYGNLLVMPNSGGEPFPMFIKFSDAFLILFLVTILSVLASYLPVKYLIKKNFSQIEF